MKSLQARLHVGIGATLTLLMLMMWWITSLGFNHIAEEMISSRLEHDGEALLASLQRDDSGQWSLKESQVGHIYQRVFSGHYYLINIADQQIRSRSLWDSHFETPLSKHQLGPNDQPLLIWQTLFQINHQDVTIIVAEDITALKQSLQTFTEFYALGCLLILMVLLLVQGLVVKRSLATVTSVSDELEALFEGDINSLSSEVPEEIKPLVGEVNRLLQLLTQRLQRSRNAMGNLAHSLKHPLNLLMLLAQNEGLDSTTKTDLNTHTQRIYQLMERELKRARLAGSGLPGQHFDIDVELPALIEVLNRVYQDKQLNIHYQADHNKPYPIDRNDMLELLGNLLDNACKWANTEVVCTIHCNDGINIIIEDDGTGCDAAHLAQLTQRGARIDESVAGSGLGLAIVSDIVELYQGSLTFEQAALGGLRVKVTLP